jgi:hypothetical protein
MGVDWLHPQYETNKDIWRRCRDVIGGSDAVKAAGPLYLPKLSGQSPEDYGAYRDRALFYNATARTVGGLVGAIFRKAPEIAVPKIIEPFLQDVTLQDEPFDSLAKALLDEIMTVGRAGILVDMPMEASPDYRPYLTSYSAEQIRNWRTVKIGDLTLLSLVVLYEEYLEIDDKDPFAFESKGRYRVLELLMEGAKRIYRQTIWRKGNSEARDAWIAEPSFIPLRRGEAWDFIPFIFLGPSSISPNVERSAIVDLVDVNLSHYRSSADLEHGRHYTALPTVWVAGFSNDGKDLQIGGSTAWVTERTDAKAGILEFTGQGLGALEKALAEKEQKMAALGARLLEDQKAVQEAAETVRLRHSGENSVLQSIAQTLGMGLAMALRWMSIWAGADPKAVSVRLNDEFIQGTLDPAMLQGLITSLQTGAMSFETFYANLVRGGIAREGVTAEQEKADIDAGTPEPKI